MNVVEWGAIQARRRDPSARIDGPVAKRNPAKRNPAPQAVRGAGVRKATTPGADDASPSTSRGDCAVVPRAPGDGVHGALALDGTVAGRF